ncbi:hypothetical protein [uncultured Thiodictyon sp.]|uniref:hypothetical protein n=1 Tax=uncultured Thiodictyon sp. TaxID=1846217 RepID=UPI0025FB38DA|nr:hypothetical protein [uncultured Thiodictyon sp.]
MQALIRFFVELCLLRRAPQDLPASDTLLRLALSVDLVAGVLVGLASGLGLGSSVAQGIAELAFQLGLLYAALRLTGHLGRFTQSATALLGSGALFGLLALGPLGLSPTGSEESDAAALGAFLLLGLVVWNLVVIGHIVRHTFGLSLAQGVVVGLAYEVSAIVLIAVLFGAS